MKKLLPVTALLFLFAIIAGCGGGKNKNFDPQFKTEPTERSSGDDKTTNITASNQSTEVYYEEEEKKEQAGNAPLYSSVATLANDSLHQFIKTADLKFRVEDVVKGTYEIEDMARRFGGWVTHTKLESRIDNKTLIPISPDSSLETVYYTSINYMTIRIPHIKMDSFLRALSPLVEFLDYRTVDAEDVRLQLLANQLAQTRLKLQQIRMNKGVDEQGNDLGDITSSLETMLMRQEQADNAKIENLSMKDKIDYNTITLNIYQRQSIKREMIANDKNIDAYEPGFGSKMGNSFKQGWKAFKTIVIFATNFWILFVLLFAVLGGYQVYKRLRK